MPHRSLTVRIAAGAIAGITAAAAYALEQKIDLMAFDYPTDDRLLLGRLLTRDNASARTVGLAIHLLNGAAVGTAYTLVAEPLLPGPPAVKGLTFALAETVALYPLALLGNHHPAIKDGTLAPYWNPTAFRQQVLRHVAFGATLGPVADRLLHR